MALDWLGAVPEGGPEGLRARRAAAVAHLAEHGLPGRKDEAWRDTPRRAILAGRPGAPRPVEVPVLAGVTRVVVGEDAGGAGASWLRPWRGAPPAGLFDEATPEAPVEPGVEAVNLALAAAGVDVDLPAGTDGGVLHLAHAGVAARHRLRLGAGSRLVVVEHHLGGGGLRSAVSRVEVGEGAALTWLQLVDLDAGTHLLGRVAAAVAAGGRLVARSLLLGGGLLRAEFPVTLAGAEAAADLGGVGIAGGDDARDHLTLVEHRGDRTRSEQRFRYVLDERARGVFNGLVRVVPGVAGIEAHQGARGILLSDEAEVHHRPQLEIRADEVACTHGAAIGGLDEEALFFLRARGLSAEDAARLVLRGFAFEVLDGWPEDAGRAWAEAALGRRLGQGGS